jgi:hypothetical protein
MVYANLDGARFDAAITLALKKGKEKAKGFGFAPPRHDFFGLDAEALREDCFCPIQGVA